MYFLSFFNGDTSTAVFLFLSGTITAVGHVGAGPYAQGRYVSAQIYNNIRENNKISDTLRIRILGTSGEYGARICIRYNLKRRRMGEQIVHHDKINIYIYIYLRAITVPVGSWLETVMIGQRNIRRIITHNS